ncbi:Hypothetical protein R9X50_00710700 [Acrodontium crateriforme]|uniref:Alpha-N-acetylglucosaminidase n=1 Tax=Acrodontium crateriforme TaxID=150365 RepID=A0AAQ3MB98_9PEZI|nr:Hypothetical protein R9X50_00710700 [Acrodontium crateriforme]
MKLHCLFLAVVSTGTAFASAYSTAGIEALVRRRLPDHCNDITFSLTVPPSYSSSVNKSAFASHNDSYAVSNGGAGKIHISGTSPSALATGLRYYLKEFANVDIHWFLGSRLNLAPKHLPAVNSTLKGASIVPYRYHFNTVTFSYTSAFWSWTDWEEQLDWMSLHGINLPLAWVGYEKILTDVFLEAGFTHADLASFLSGPAFQAWNRFGNIQGSWGGDLPKAWIEGQFELQKKIIARMVELGMTPVLPCFTGFVPSRIGEIYPNASFVTGSQWNGFPAQYTDVKFLEPFDPLFTTLQKSFIEKQQQAYGQVSSLYTLDQYNENNPYSGDTDYLRNVTANTMKSLKAADPEATWMLQGWLFYSSQSFWTNERVEAYLGGVSNEDMLIIDLFSESQPQWQRTNNYYGKPWIWCELHDYGSNMGLYGQVENVTINPIDALNNKSTTMVGMGLTMEGQEGNEIMYDILLDQAWSETSLNSEIYFHDWVTTRYYSSKMKLPSSIYKAWNILRQTVYNNTQLSQSTGVTKSIFELSPNTTGLLNRTGHHATVIIYDPVALVSAWQDFYSASSQSPQLWKNKPYVFDLTDMTRQVLANAFVPLYTSFVTAANKSDNATYSIDTARRTGSEMLALLADLDAVLVASGEAAFTLGPWIEAARAWAGNDTKSADFYEYNLRNQVTLWGPTGQISDYSSRQWGGLVKDYYVPRWKLFIEYTLRGDTTPNGANSELAKALLTFEESWQMKKWESEKRKEVKGDVEKTIKSVAAKWGYVFGN